MYRKRIKIARDLLLITLLVLSFGALIYLFSSILRPKPTAPHGQTQITIVVEDIPYELLEDVKIEERVLDRTHRAILGRIASLSTHPHTYEQAVNGESVIVTKDGYCDAYFVVRRDGEGVRDALSYYIGEGVVISTPSLAAEGRVFAILTEGDE